MLLIRHLLRTLGHVLGFALRGRGGGTALLVLVGAPLVILAGAIKVAGWAVLYPFL